MCSSWWIWLNSHLESGFLENIMITHVLSLSGIMDSFCVGADRVM